MVKLQIKETDLNKAKSWSESVFLDDDLLLTEHINKAPMPTEPRKMNFILIGLCTKGRIEYRLDTQEMIINPGDILIVSDKHVVDKYQPSPDMEGLCMMLSVNFFHEIIQNVRDVNSLFLFARSHPVMSLDRKEQDTFKEYFQVIKQKIGDNGNFFHKDLIRTLLLAMFYDVGNIINRVRKLDKPQTRAEAIFTNFIKMVEANYKHERRISWYAIQLGITPKYLSETVKAVSRRTPNEWVDNYVMMELRVLLKNSTKSIKEITEEMNFPNQSFLGKFFKEHVGISPNKFRKL
ncbi:AraC-type DNA-binding protein [Xylanibacter ruminicola]|uniref:AraC-type DNA-binding protein n=1 Tax=Xylanibacter ruminicola TaxID=839 RepID=A0A1H5SZN0_XYLRU|nr:MULTISPECIES: helix-turn-helix domain-containing protein [Prevotellaceae]SEF55301.1 AraC-type DNA-binding protein [Xylanibacter ruminicola]SEV95559.1 AraC-type DNA-binding protein [Prevotella sp. khp7]